MTIKDIITGQKNMVSGRYYEGTKYLGGKYEVSINKIVYQECSYSKIREYRRQEGGFRPVDRVKYFFTYSTFIDTPRGLKPHKRVESKHYDSIAKMYVELREMGLTEKTPSQLEELISV